VSACQLIEEKTDVEVCRDPDDDKFISCAVDAECLYIVSGDKDLLALERYEGIGILTVAQFFEQVWNDD
jgi:predicted nucleic acid-binding protein